MESTNSTALQLSPQQHREQITQWARRFALIRRSIPNGELRDGLDSLWRAIRAALNNQHSEIIDIRSIAAAGSFTLPPRPPTSESVAQCREAVGRALEEAAAEVGQASATAYVLKDLDPTWAREFITRKYYSPSCTTPLGCWNCSLQPGHPNGYIKINLRNTPYPNRKLDIQPWLHQLVIVGKGEGGRLPLTTGAGGYEVSHLCHNPACFNPAHLVVERAGLNSARNSCRDRTVLEIEGVAVINPCPHWDDEAWNNGECGLGKSCVLPKVTITKDLFGRHIDIGYRGRLKSRG